MNVQGQPFITGTTFEEIVFLYECDAKLRNTCFEAVGQFEILLRNAISETLSANHGSHPYFEIGAFKSAQARIDAVNSFIAVYKNSKDQRAKHYKNTYHDPILPPIWAMKEFLTFGASSRIYKNLAGVLRTQISNSFGVRSDQVFENWVTCLVDLRNICAHHDRLFNRSFQKSPA
jgi:abortive infection bacteriophage resistance protein